MTFSWDRSNGKYVPSVKSCSLCETLHLIQSCLLRRKRSLLYALSASDCCCSAVSLCSFLCTSAKSSCSAGSKVEHKTAKIERTPRTAINNKNNNQPSRWHNHTNQDNIASYGLEAQAQRICKSVWLRCLFLLVVCWSWSSDLLLHAFHVIACPSSCSSVKVFLLCFFLGSSFGTCAMLWLFCFHGVL